MSFGKRRDAHDLTDLPFDLQGDLARLVGLVGLWMVYVDLRGGQRHLNLKLQILKDKIAKNAQKFEQRPLIAALLRAVQDAPFPAPLPPDQVCDYARTVLSVASQVCDPRDIGALRLVLLDISQSILRAEPTVVGPTTDPFFAGRRSFSETMRHWVRQIGRINDSSDRLDYLSPTAHQAMLALVSALGAEDLWNLDLNSDHQSGATMAGLR